MCLPCIDFDVITEARNYEDLNLEVLKMILLRSAALMLTDFQTLSSL